MARTFSLDLPLDETEGGTDQSTFTKGDILYASATDTLAKLGIGTSGQALAVSAGGIPEWTEVGAGLYLKLDQTTPQTIINGQPIWDTLTASKVVFTDVSKKLTSTGIGTSVQFIKGDGSLDGSIYLTTETDPIVGAINGIVKANGAGVISAAIAGTDYQTPLVADTDYLTPGTAASTYAPITHASTHAVSGSDTVFPADPDSDKFLMWDNDPGELVWADAGATGATTALDNLASVAINESLVSDTDNTDALGTTAIAWSDLFLGSGAVITFNSAPSTPDVTITHSANTLTLAGGDLVMATSLGATGTRVLKGWFTDVEITNLPTINGGTLATALSLGTAAYTATGDYEASGAIATHAALQNVHGLAITADKTLTVQDNVTITGALGTGAYATIADYATLATPVFTSKITMGVAAGATGSLELVGTTSGVVTLTVGAEAGTWTMTLPADNGDNGQVLTTNGEGVCSWGAGGSGGIVWSAVTSDGNLVADTGTLANKGTLLTLTLPATCSVGKTIRVAGMNSGLWKIAQNADQYINFGNKVTTVGTDGSLASTLTYDAVELVCTVEDLGFTVVSSVGSITIV